MHLKTKINPKRYFLLSLVPTFICFGFARSFKEVMAIVVVYVASVINQTMLVEACLELIYPIVTKDASIKSNKSKVAFLFLGKVAVLLGGLSLGVHLMGERVIVPLLNYVALIFVLAFSLGTHTKRTI